MGCELTHLYCLSATLQTLDQSSFSSICLVQFKRLIVVREANDPLKVFSMYIPRHHPVDWENPKHNLAIKEPRHGRRLTLAATIHTPLGDLVCYSAHLEVFCGMLARIRQFADILRDSKQCIQKGLTRQVICGDLNTMGHGIARLSPSFCLDQMRFWSFGQTEAQFWHENIIMQPDEAYQPEHDSQPGECKAGVNKRLLKWGLSEDVCTDVLNPGFSDPFDPVTTITLCNPVYPRLGLFLQGKLDWLLMRRCVVEATAVGNHDYAASDHKWLSADVVLT